MQWDGCPRLKDEGTVSVTKPSIANLKYKLQTSLCLSWRVHGWLTYIYIYKLEKVCSHSQRGAVWTVISTDQSDLFVLLPLILICLLLDLAVCSQDSFLGDVPQYPTSTNRFETK